MELATTGSSYQLQEDEVGDYQNLMWKRGVTEQKLCSAGAALSEPRGGTWGLKPRPS